MELAGAIPDREPTRCRVSVWPARRSATIRSSWRGSEPTDIPDSGSYATGATPGRMGDQVELHLAMSDAMVPSGQFGPAPLGSVLDRMNTRA
jgi:hypothetical protein